MIIGNGMIAKSLNHFKDCKDVVIFASGVSNSKENDVNEFNRELEMLKKVNLKSKIIYFSSCSIFDKSLIDTKYVMHKILIEKYITENFNRYIIFRLPIVIGNNSNNNTFFSFFKNKIINNEEVFINKNSTRYIIDIDDISAILPNIINDKKFENMSYNICFDNLESVLNIFNKMEFILKKNVKKNIVNKGNFYFVDNYFFINLLNEINFKYNAEEYNFNLLKKYLLK